MKKEFAKKLLDKVRDDYNQIADDFANTRVQVWPESVLLFNCIKKGDRVLDLGCGNGRFVKIIKEKGGEYFGTDVSGKLVEIARKLYPNDNFQTTEPLKLPFPDEYFDIIFSIAVLHHIPSNDFRLEFLKEAKRILNPRGLLILTVWKPKSKKEKLLKAKFLFKKIFGLNRNLDFGDVIEPWFSKNKGERYFHCFSEKELVNLAKEAGFEIIKSGIIKNEKGNRQNIYIIGKKLP